MHESGWVHRDISLNNVLVDGEGHARSTDFEFAKRVGDEGVPEFASVGITILSAQAAISDHPSPRALLLSWP